MFSFVIRTRAASRGASEPGRALGHSAPPQPASYALKKTFFHVDRHAGHIGRLNLRSLVPLAVVQKVTRSLAAIFFFPPFIFFGQGGGAPLRKRLAIYFAYWGIYSEPSTLVTYHFIRARFTQLSASCKSSSWALFGID